VVIVEIDTFGGRLDAAVEIRDALLNADLRAIAFVNKRAISAGALITLAADDIVMTPGATIGAATPVRFTSEGPKPLGEKAISYFRKEMKATAESRNHPTALAEAMVDLDVVIPGVIEKGKLLTLTTQEALALKLAAAQSDDLEQLLQTYGLELITKDRSAQRSDVGSWLKQFRTWQVWLILGLVLAAAEIFVSGFFLLWFSVGALLASLLAWLRAPPDVQIGTFLVTSFLLLVFSRTVLRSGLFRSQANIATNFEALKGRNGVVIKTIEGGLKSGSVKLGGEVWSAVCADDVEISEGSKIEVLEIVGNKVKVKPL
jgi:membrane-bound ClpP family serine protease